MKEIKKQGMESLFCPYEQALALKELGFNESCFGLYPPPIKTVSLHHYGLLSAKEQILAPLYQQAFRWFREKYGLYSVIDGLEGRLYYKITQTNEYSKEYNTYEEAELECLKKLIEIVKND